MKTPNQSESAEDLTQAARYDLVIIGAGINGIGVAVAAVDAGLRVCLVDPLGFASQTSDNSLRIMHGGFRYLQKLDFRRSIESVKAQAELKLRYPRYMQHLECQMPLKRWGLKSPMPAFFGAKLYALILRAFGKSDKTEIAAPQVTRTRDAAEPSWLDTHLGTYLLGWSDLQLVEPREFVQELTCGMTLEQKSCRQILSVKKSAISQQTSAGDPAQSSGTDVDNSSATSPEVYQLVLSDGAVLLADRVVNTAAAGVSQIRTGGLLKNPMDRIQHWAHAINFVFSKPADCRVATGLQASAEDRLYFLVPRESDLAVGTFYLPADQSQSQSFSLTDPRLSNFMTELMADIPELAALELLRVEQGLLPCSKEFSSEADLISSPRIIRDENYCEVYFAKYTTFLRTGRQILEEILS